MNTLKNKLWSVLLFMTSLLPLFPGEIVSFPVGILEINFLFNAEMFSWNDLSIGLWAVLVLAQLSILIMLFVEYKKIQRYLLTISPVSFTLCYLILNFRRDISWDLSMFAAVILSLGPFLILWGLMINRTLSMKTKTQY
jgi:hypothetical protein